jgi:hypothetical protein
MAPQYRVDDFIASRGFHGRQRRRVCLQCANEAPECFAVQCFDGAPIRLGRLAPIEIPAGKNALQTLDVAEQTCEILTLGGREFLGAHRSSPVSSDSTSARASATSRSFSRSLCS